MCEASPAPLPQGIVADGSRMLDYAGPDAESIKRFVGTHGSLLRALACPLHGFGHLETSDSRNQRSDLSDYTPIVKRGERFVPSLVGAGKPEERKNQVATKLWPAPAR